MALIHVATTTVQTTGVNWESVGTIVAAIVATMTFVFGMFARYVSNKITGAIDRFRIEVIAKMDTRLTVLEQIVFGRKVRHDDDS